MKTKKNHNNFYQNDTIIENIFFVILTILKILNKDLLLLLILLAIFPTLNGYRTSEKGVT